MEQAADGRLVNWHTHTLTFIPSLELRYRRPFGPVTITLTSAYTYFATTPIARSTEAYSFTSDSQVWSNRVELGVYDALVGRALARAGRRVLRAHGSLGRAPARASRPTTCTRSAVTWRSIRAAGCGR